MNRFNHFARGMAFAGSILVFGTGTVFAQGACGIPVPVKGSQSVLPPVTLSDGQDVRVHLRNHRNQEVEIAVAYFIPGEEMPIARTQATLSPGETMQTDLQSSCLFKVCTPGPEDDPYAVQAVVSTVYERPVTAFRNPAAFDDPALGFDDPALGFDDPALGFDDPALGFDDPLVGFEVYDIATGRTGIWGNGGTYLKLLPAGNQ